MGGGRTTAAVIATAAFLLLSRAATAAPCGDDVNGARVACRCGDTVISDTKLRSDDPVVTTRCPLDGLTIRAVAQAEAITLDLDGLAIVGSGAGMGIRVLYGGADGVRIVGAQPGARGVVRKFGTGISSPAGDAVAHIARLEVRENRHDGMRLVMADSKLDPRRISELVPASVTIGPTILEIVGATDAPLPRPSLDDDRYIYFCASD